MSNANELLQFIRCNNLYVTNQGGSSGASNGNLKKPNYLSLSGGSWFIPKSLMHEFYNIIRRMIVSKIPISIVEVRSDIFKYFIDLDIVSPFAIKTNTLHKIAHIIHTSIKHECELNGRDMTLTQYGYMAEPRVIHGKDAVKTGVHIYYPDLQTNTTLALELRKRLIVAFASHSDLDMLVWKDVIDESVYKTSGLRLPHIPKLKKCKCVKNNGECQNGCTFGVINENAIYTPAWCITKDCSVMNESVVEKLRNNLRYSLELTMIRTSSDVVNFSLRNRCHVACPNDTTNMTTMVKGIYQTLDDPRRKPVATSRKDVNNLYIDDQQIVDYDTQQKIESFIRRNYEVYSTLQVQIVKRVIFKALNSNITYIKYFVGTTTKFCQNIEREHKNNHIYFIIFISGRSMKIAQRCHSTCSARQFNAKEICKTYSSIPIDIKHGSDLYKTLAPPSLSTDLTCLTHEDYETAVANTMNIDITDNEHNKLVAMPNLRDLVHTQPT